MKWPWEKKDLSIETIIRRLEATFQTVANIPITPESALESPTVNAIVTAISRRIASAPVEVFQKGLRNGRIVRNPLPNHPVAILLRKPNDWQTPNMFWLDAASSFVRYGRFYAAKAQGRSGPIRVLQPLHASAVTPKQNASTLAVSYMVHRENGGIEEVPPSQIFHARGASTGFLEGDSPVMHAREAIAMEIAAERFGAGYFGNGAMPLVFLKLMPEFRGFESDEAQNRFIQSYQEAFSGKKRFRAAMLPKGIEPHVNSVDNEKSQFIETRKLLRTVIAGVFNAPPHVAGDLERATMNNVEQQDKDFVINCVMPVANAFQDAMEHDLLDDNDRENGVTIRFDLDAVQRANFLDRQEGLRTQREMGVINANEWREMESRNPLSEDEGGEDYIRPLNHGTRDDGNTETQD